MAIDKAKALAAAQKQLGRNNIDRALKELSRIVRDDPKDLRVRQKVAELLARQGKVAEAMREFAVVAEAYERGGFYPKAAAIYKQMLRFEPDQMRWHLALGEIYQQLALLSDAMDHFNIVAQYFDQNGSGKERIEIYEKLLKLNPDSIEYAEKLADLHAKEADTASAYEVWKALAAALEQRGDVEVLLRVYEKMTALHPDDLVLVRTLADLYLDRGDPRRALAKLQLCFKADPQDTETLNLLADAFVDLGEREKAVAVLKELAQIYDSLGYEDYRNQVYDRIAEIDPAQGASIDSDASLELPGGESAVEGLDLGEAEPANEAVDRAVAEAEVYLQYGLADKARALLGKVTAQHPAGFKGHRLLVRILALGGEVPQAQDRLGTMYEIAMDLGNYAVARTCLERASDLAPDDEAARARLDAFVEAMGDYANDDAAAPDEAEAMASAIELGMTIAESAGETARHGGEFENGVDEFDFDDAEMQRLAEELSREVDDQDGSSLADDLSSHDEVRDPEELDETEAQDPGEDEDDEDDGGRRSPAGGDDPFGDIMAGLDFDLDDESLLEMIPARGAFAKGRAHFDAGRFQEAAAEFQRAIDEDADTIAALEYLGHSLRQIQDYRGAVDAYKRLLAGGVTDRDEVLRIMFELGATYEAAGNRLGAFKIFKKITERETGFRDGSVLDRVKVLAQELGIR